jgi:hypothetical protein
MCLHLKEEGKMKSKFAVSLLSILLLAIFGCSKPESKYVGIWSGKTGTFQFADNMTGLINPPAGVNLPKNVPFKWSLQGKDTVRIDVGPPIGKTFFGKMISNENLIIEDDKFVKMK